METSKEKGQDALQGPPAAPPHLHTAPSLRSPRDKDGRTWGVLTVAPAVCQPHAPPSAYIVSLVTPFRR